MLQNLPIEEKSKSEQSKSFHIALVLGAIILGVSFVLYLPLIAKPSGARGVPVLNTFFSFILPVACSHIAVVLLLQYFKKKILITFLFWGISLLILIAAGTVKASLALLGLIVYVVVLVQIGKTLKRLLFPESFEGLGIALGLGILASSILIAYLAVLHTFVWWTFASLLIGLSIFSWFQNPPSFFSLRNSWKLVSRHWNLATAIALEGLFLTIAYVYVDTSAPERASDALQYYWPYVKLLKYHSGFFSNPYQWSYVIPQAGLTYAAGIYCLFGSFAVRLAMFLAWMALIGITIRSLDDKLDLKISVVLLLASSPIVLNLSSSLMQDTFVSLVIVLLAFVCLEGKNPGSKWFWLAVGSLLGVAWTSKFSAPAYAIPLLFFAFRRVPKTTIWWQQMSSLLFIVAGGLATAAPWLWNTWRQTGTPFFPLLLNLFPSTLWPYGVDLADLENYKLFPGLRGWLLSFLDFTYQTDRFINLIPGSLGFILPALLLLVPPALLHGSRTEKALIISGMIGTALLWIGTAYVRYWLPGLWLVTAAALPGALWYARFSWLRVRFCVIAIVISLSHIPFEMLISFSDYRGFPWDYYSGKVSDQTYIRRNYWGFEKFQDLGSLIEEWPRVWVTNFPAAGHLKIQPMNAAIWEIRRHGFVDPRSWVNYLGSTGCKYWIVNKRGIEAFWFQELGLWPYYWDEKSAIATDGTLTIYKMKTAQEAIQKFDERASPGSELLMNGGFEQQVISVKHWLSGNAQWFRDPKLAKNGLGSVRLPPEGAFSQYVPLPPELKQVELSGWARAVSITGTVQLKLEILWVDNQERVMAWNEKTIASLPQWNQEDMTSLVPKKAVWGIVRLTNTDTRGEIYLDDVHLVSK